MTPVPTQVLVLCTGNSARSVLAEALFNHLGGGRVVAHSAGSKPVGRVNPRALEALTGAGLPTAGLRSKSWDEFAAGAHPLPPTLDLVVTVCDNAAGETCPLWTGAPMRVHWGLPDPAAVEGPQQAQRQAFAETMLALRSRIERLLALPLHSTDRTALQAQIQALHGA
jgi:arsenate reductase (thioredoxin)